MDVILIIAVVGGIAWWLYKRIDKAATPVPKAAPDKTPPPLPDWISIFENERTLATLPKRFGIAAKVVVQWRKDGLLLGKLAKTADWFLEALKWDKADEAEIFLSQLIASLPDDLAEDLLFGTDTGWARARDLLQSGNIGWKADVFGWPSAPGALFFGHVKSPDDGSPVDVKYDGDGHVLMVAPAGAGKNQRFILPNLMSYNGPVICLDPKGENYKHTAWHRDVYGKVFKFSPFDPKGDSDCFNPMDFVKTWDDARTLTSLLITPGKTSDVFWDREATRLIAACILYLKTIAPAEKQNFRALYSLLSSQSFMELKNFMQESENTNLQDMGNTIARSIDGDGEPNKQFSSIIQTALSHLEIWGSDAIAKVTASTTTDFNIPMLAGEARAEELWSALGKGDEVKKPGPHFDGDMLVRGGAASIYIIMPADKIREYAAVLRVMLGWNLKLLLNNHQEPRPNDPPRRPFLFLFDELPQLGPMDVIEDAVAIARGYGIRLWLVTQDLAQLSQVYEKWESLVSNCQAQIFFGINDGRTAETVAERLGRRSDAFGNSGFLASPQDLTGPKFADRGLVFLRGLRPTQIYLNEPFHSHPTWRPHTDNNKASWEQDLLNRRHGRERDGESKAFQEARENQRAAAASPAPPA